MAVREICRAWSPGLKNKELKMGIIKGLLKYVIYPFIYFSNFQLVKLNLKLSSRATDWNFRSTCTQLWLQCMDAEIPNNRERNKQKDKLFFELTLTANPQVFLQHVHCLVWTRRYHSFQTADALCQAFLSSCLYICNPTLADKKCLGVAEM